MADVNAKLGGAVTFEYLALPPGFNGRGGVVKTYMVIRGIQFTEAPKVNFPIDAKAKQGLIDAGKSKLGALPVVTIGDKHFAGHLPILRYLEAKGGIGGTNLEEDYLVDELADEYTSWRNAWAGTLGGDAGNVEKYKTDREKFYSLMNLFYSHKKEKASSYLLGGSLPRYADVAVYVMMSDDQATNGTMDLSKYSGLEALWKTIRALPNAKDFIV